LGIAVVVTGVLTAVVEAGAGGTAALSAICSVVNVKMVVVTTALERVCEVTTLCV
jgi:hypothetical protein